MDGVSGSGTGNQVGAALGNDHFIDITALTLSGRVDDDSFANSVVNVDSSVVELFVSFSVKKDPCRVNGATGVVVDRRRVPVCIEFSGESETDSF